MTLPGAPILNAMTIDVEDYFQVSAFAGHIAREAWDQQESRVERNVDRILAMLDQYGVRATFFTLGWIAERHPALVRRIVAGGHEVASHGYSHRRVTDQSPADFRGDIDRAKKILEDTSGAEVKGYRAPSFSIGERNLWALDVLAEAGFRYSSSIYPIAHDHYGMPKAPRFAFRAGSAHQLLEVPATTVRICNRNWPASGGGYFRLLPYAVSRWSIGRVNGADQEPCVFYFHPWELDPDQPRMQGIGLQTRFRHYVNLSRTEGRIRQLLGDFLWGRMDRIFLEGRP
jgi:polysaccharide deacetylase family protein (PEP-CTERM system associated)